MSEALGRFNHHPDPAIDFCIEVEELQAISIDMALGLASKFEQQSFDERLFNAMSFRVGGDEGAIAAKSMLRELEKVNS